MSASGLLSLRINSIRYVAKDTHAFELVHPDSLPLPPASAGAHVSLNLRDGLQREYSLVHAGDQLMNYVVGVKRLENGRGGSRYVHDQLKVGQILDVGSPRNNFPLYETAANSVFFAGGIGVTPIVSMLERLAELGRPATLYYAVQQRSDLAFLPEISRVCSPNLHVDDEQNGVFDIARVIGELLRSSHLYCCGPQGMMEAFERATADWPADQLHVEYFTPKQTPQAEGGFSVVLKRSGKEIFISPGQTILTALQDAGVSLPFSCRQGICGACETPVLEGVPDHCDSVLSAKDQESNKVIMVCCSGSKTPRLVLDI